MYKIIDCYHEIKGYTKGLRYYVEWYGSFSRIPRHIRKRYKRWRVDFNGCTIGYYYDKDEAFKKHLFGNNSTGGSDCPVRYLQPHDMLTHKKEHGAGYGSDGERKRHSEKGGEFQMDGYGPDDPIKLICDRCRASEYYLISEIDKDGYFTCKNCHAPNYV